MYTNSYFLYPKIRDKLRLLGSVLLHVSDCTVLIEPNETAERNPIRSHSIGQYIRAAKKTKENLLKTEKEKHILEKSLNIFK